MRRYFESLRPADVSALHSVPDGLFLGSSGSSESSLAQAKALLRDPLGRTQAQASDRVILTGRLYCTPKAMWKLIWFLRDFGYDQELLGKNEIEDERLVDLWGVVRLSEATVHGIAVLNFDGFAPASRWEELSIFNDIDRRGSGVPS